MRASFVELIVQFVLDLDSEEASSVKTLALIIKNIQKEFDDAEAVGLTASKVADVIVDDYEELAFSLYKRAAELILKDESCTLFAELVAGLCYEKAKVYCKAERLYEKLGVKVSSTFWKDAIKGFEWRVRAKISLDNECFAQGCVMFLWAATCFSKALQKCDAASLNEKWRLSKLEMHSQSELASALFYASRQGDAPLVRPGTAWQKIKQPKDAGYERSAIYANAAEGVSASVLITGAMHGNEFSGTLAFTELSRWFPTTISAVLWPCIDGLGYHCQSLLRRDRGEEVPEPFPAGTEDFYYVPEYRAFAAIADQYASYSWLSDIAAFAGSLQPEYDARYLVWMKAATSPEGDGMNEGGRSYEINQNGLVMTSAPEATCETARMAAEFIGSRQHACWIDLHESRGDGFHIYLSAAPSSVLLTAAEQLIEHLSELVPINREIWNREAVSPGIFKIPENSRLWGKQQRIVLEVGEELPLHMRVGVLSESIRFLCNGVCFGKK